MTDYMIPLDAAIDRLTELSCDDNAHWGAIIDALRAIPAIDHAAIREAALREAYEVVYKWWFGDGNALPQELILAMIGEKK